MSHHETPTDPGWYDDPEGNKNLERYWNGNAWSGAPRNKPPSLEISGVILIVVGVIVGTILAWWFFFAL